METEQLVRRLDAELRYPEFGDSIVDIVRSVDTKAELRFSKEYLSNATGLMINNGAAADRVLCAVFPSREVFGELLSRGAADALLFVKHPLEWEDFGQGFVPLDEEQIQFLKDRSISLYSAHAPVDNQQVVAPSYGYALQFDFKVAGEISINGRNYGYVVEPSLSTDYDTIKELILHFTGLRRLQEHYDHPVVKRIAVSAGGGDNLSVLEAAIEKGCDTYATGILYFRGSEHAIAHNPPFVARLKQSGLNGFGATHYLTEIEGIRTFADFVGTKLGIHSTFIYEPNRVASLRERWGMVI